MALYIIQNGPMPTTAAFAKVATGTAIKTMLQVKMGATRVGKIKKWWASMDAFAAALPVNVELIETDVAATVTAHVTAGINKIDGAALAGGDPVTAAFEVSTTATGYTASAEGSITVVRFLDGAQLESPTNQFIYTFPLGDEPVIQLAKFARIRVKAGTDVNMICGMKIEV